ncbi:MAG: thioredoxin domain-containing protein [Myxococcales bacterium]|nr:thioredoxin domain-containing protein [Myxococcales bacterium]
MSDDKLQAANGRTGGPSRRANRLANETSPYLLQHAHNPVDWHPWGPEALALARATDRPILLSIGYSACHWCHVMERESFENEATAAQMNEHFVCIKVDREERPDLDSIYMAATVAMSGSGGWPMTVFLTPEQKPFFAGTYFPPRDLHGRPGFPTLLARIASLWQGDKRVTLEDQASELTRVVREQSVAGASENLTLDTLARAETDLERSFDSQWGGFGRAPKFPPAQSLRFLLRRYRRHGRASALSMVETTLDRMANGGLRDQLGGGFHRYSTDAEWLVPHFEKMLYDNALLAIAYAEAWQTTGNERHAQVARSTLDYVLAEMTSPDGLFYSATDADSEGVEGKFFVWTPDAIEGVLPPASARAFMAYYDVSPQGNWEGQSILRTTRPLASVAAELSLAEAELESLLAKARLKLYAARQERVPPLLDDKILSAWNGLMIAAFAECGRILDAPQYKDAAARAADALLHTMRRPDGGLFRTTRAGKTHLSGVLEDYAYVADALLDCYEAGVGGRFLAAAAELGARIVRDFRDPEHGDFYATAHDHEPLIVRPREAQDGALPSPSAVAAKALVRLSRHTNDPELRAIATRALMAHGRIIARAPRAFVTSLMVLDGLFEGPGAAVLVASPTLDSCQGGVCEAPSPNSHDGDEALSGDRSEASPGGNIPG